MTPLSTSRCKTGFSYRCEPVLAELPGFESGQCGTHLAALTFIFPPHTVSLETTVDLSPLREHPEQARTHLCALRNAGATVSQLRSAWQRCLDDGSRERKSRGVYYTGFELATSIVEDLLEQRPGWTPSSVLEPCAGGGAFVIAMIAGLMNQRSLLAEEAAARIVAWDADPVGIELARLAVEERFGSDVAAAVRFSSRDALSYSDTVEAFDLVISNPPFGNAIEKETARTREEREALARRFPLAMRGASDRASIFVERMHQLCDDRGVLCALLPRAFLAQPASRELRKALVARYQSLDLLLIETTRAFEEADVSVAAVILGGVALQSENTDEGAHTSAAIRVRTIGRDDSRSFYTTPPVVAAGYWGALLTPFIYIARHEDSFIPLGELVELSAGSTTQEAYQWRPEIHEGQPDSHAKGLLTAGAVDPFRIYWGKQTIRYLGGDWLHPLIPLDVLSARRLRWASEAKVIVAGLSRVLEAAPDEEGRYVGAVSTILARPRDPHVPVARLAAILNSMWTRIAYRARFGPMSLSGGNLQVTSNKLREVPVPGIWFEAVDARDDLLPALPEVAMGRELPDVASWNRLVAYSRVLEADRPGPEAIMLVDQLVRDAPHSRWRRGHLDMALMAAAGGWLPIEDEA